MNSSAKTNCCLICSILTALSDVNCCSEHLKLLSTVIPSKLSTPLCCIMSSTNSDWNESESCSRPGHSTSNKRHRFSSSSSSESQNENRKRSKHIESVVRISLNKEISNDIPFF